MSVLEEAISKLPDLTDDQLFDLTVSSYDLAHLEPHRDYSDDFHYLIECACYREWNLREQPMRYIEAKQYAKQQRASTKGN